MVVSLWIEKTTLVHATNHKEVPFPLASLQRLGASKSGRPGPLKLIQDLFRPSAESSRVSEKIGGKRVRENKKKFSISPPTQSCSHCCRIDRDMQHNPSHGAHTSCGWPRGAEVHRAAAEFLHRCEKACCKLPQRTQEA